jgi:hypothetical protein
MMISWLLIKITDFKGDSEKSVILKITVVLLR